MPRPERPRLKPLQLANLRRALAAKDAKTPAARFRESMAFFLVISLLLWHGGRMGPLSTSRETVLRHGWFVSPAAGKATEESMNMKRRTNIGAAAIGAAALVTSAQAQNSGYARFDQTSDTIRIYGNTAFVGVDSTYEMRLRMSPAASGTPGHVVSEQRDSVEAKILKLSSATFVKDTVRGGNCGDVDNMYQFDAGALSAWRHIAWVRQGSVARLYLDGQLVNTWTEQSNCAADYADSTMSLGMFRNGAPCCWGPALPSFLGDLDWIRISSGARYVTNFTPPFECEIAADPETQLLLRFNEPAGTTTLTDESASGFLCVLGVPVEAGVVATSPSLGNSIGGFPACPPLCTADIDENSTVDGVDLAIILGRWGTNPKDYPRADTNDDGVVDGVDLAAVLNGWGNCP